MVVGLLKLILGEENIGCSSSLDLWILLDVWEDEEDLRDGSRCFEGTEWWDLLDLLEVCAGTRGRPLLAMMSRADEFIGYADLLSPNGRAKLVASDG